MTHIAFPSINQYRQIIKNVRKSADYHRVPYPTIDYELTVKIHGTNGGIVRPVNGDAQSIYFQSRERLVTIESDNAGFAFFGETNREILNEIFEKIKEETGAETGNIQIYGEWFGGNSQKSVGVNLVPKTFCVFGIRISDTAESSNWEPKGTFLNVFGDKLYAGNRIYTKYDFPHWYVSVDFNRPELSQNKFIELCSAVETDCPVARYFNPEATVELIGEGVVATPIFETSVGFDYRSNVLKVKGEKHSVSKVKTLAVLDPEKMTSLNSFIEYAVTDNRLTQGLEKMRELQHPIDMTSTGHFIKWVMADVMKEELDTMIASLIEPKDINGPVAKKAKEFWTMAVDAE
jgi:hypothetical protein